MKPGKRAEGPAQLEGTAIAEFEKAEKAKSTPEERSLLVNARAQLKIARDKVAVQIAQAQSASYEQLKDILKAYQLLDQLPHSQRTLVAG